MYWENLLLFIVGLKKMLASYLSMKTPRGGQYVPSLFLRLSKLTAVLMPMEASMAAIRVVGTCCHQPSGKDQNFATQTSPTSSLLTTSNPED